MDRQLFLVWLLLHGWHILNYRLPEGETGQSLYPSRWRVVVHGALLELMMGIHESAPNLLPRVIIWTSKPKDIVLEVNFVSISFNFLYAPSSLPWVEAKQYRRTLYSWVLLMFQCKLVCIYVSFSMGTVWGRGIPRLVAFYFELCLKCEFMELVSI